MSVALDHSADQRAYDRAFADECQKKYPVVDAIEQEYGHAVDRTKIEEAARVLACPVKKNAPNWQHGRVIYSVLANYVGGTPVGSIVSCLDVGTAKGFSALCMEWALSDAGDDVRGILDWYEVYSVDVVGPEERVRRNTVAEVGGYKTLAEILEPWPESKTIKFSKNTGVGWLSESRDRINFAFVDGKHQYETVRTESRLIAQRQEPGDVAIFDDVHVPGVRQAVGELKGYAKRHVQILPNRAYAICVKE